MRLHISIGLDETDAPGASYTIQTDSGPVTLSAECGACVLDVGKDGKSLAVHDECERHEPAKKPA